MISNWVISIPPSLIIPNYTLSIQKYQGYNGDNGLFSIFKSRFFNWVAHDVLNAYGLRIDYTFGSETDFEYAWITHKLRMGRGDAVKTRTESQRFWIFARHPSYPPFLQCVPDIQDAMWCGICASTTWSVRSRSWSMIIRSSFWWLWMCPICQKKSRKPCIRSLIRDMIKIL